MSESITTASLHPSPEAAPHRYAPAPVDFDQLAAQAIEAGLFSPNAEPHGQQNTLDNTPRLPERMLEATYGNGPARIQFDREDVPVAVMRAFRKNVASANRLLTPQDSVLRYFHQRYTRADVFDSAGMRQAFEDYRPFVGSMSLADSDKSFQVEGVDRSTKNRQLFTAEEKKAAIELADQHPELALTIIGYQGIMRDYIGELSTAFERAAERQPGTVTKRDIDEVTNVAEQWTSSNFTDNLMPALAIFIARKKQLDPEIPTAEITTPELFNDAVDFIISNGAFRNFVTVPAEIAADGQERVNHFLCPAVGTIRDQLLDGSLLHTVHRATVARIEAGDSSALGLREHIQTRAQESLLRIAEDEKWQRQQAMEAARPFVPIETQGKTWADIACDAIAQTTARQKPALFNFEGQEYRVVLDQEWSGLVAHEPKQQGDTEIELRAGDVLYNVLGTSAATALQTEGDVFFSFNGDPYRITCANVQALFQNSIIQ